MRIFARLTEGTDTKEFVYLAIIGGIVITLIFGRHLFLPTLASVAARLF